MTRFQADLGRLIAEMCAAISSKHKLGKRAKKTVKDFQAKATARCEVKKTARVAKEKPKKSKKKGARAQRDVKPENIATAAKNPRNLGQNQGRKTRARSADQDRTPDGRNRPVAGDPIPQPTDQAQASTGDLCVLPGGMREFDRGQQGQETVRMSGEGQAGGPRDRLVAIRELAMKKASESDISQNS